MSHWILDESIGCKPTAQPHESMLMIWSSLLRCIFSKPSSMDPSSAYFRYRRRRPFSILMDLMRDGYLFQPTGIVHVQYNL